MTDEKRRAARLEQTIYSPGHCQRVREMFERLEAGHQAEAVRSKVITAKDPLPEEWPDVRPGRRDGSPRRFHPDHPVEAVLQQVFQEGAVSRADVQGPMAVR